MRNYHLIALTFVILLAIPASAYLSVSYFERWAHEMVKAWNMDTRTFAFAALLENRDINRLKDNVNGQTWVNFCGEPTNMLLGKFWNMRRFRSPAEFIVANNEYEIVAYNTEVAENSLCVQYNGENLNKLRNKRTLLAVWSNRCVITRNYIIPSANANNQRYFYAPHYEEIFAAYWRHVRPTNKWAMVYSSKKPCDYGTRDCQTIRDCSKLMADLFLARPMVGRGLQNTAYQTVYISDLKVNQNSRHCHSRDPNRGRPQLGFVNWIATESETDQGLQFSSEFHDERNQGLLSKHTYPENTNVYNLFLNMGMSKLAQHVLWENNNRRNRRIGR